jgi:hypothetical protein
MRRQVALQDDLHPVLHPSPYNPAMNEMTAIVASFTPAYASTTALLHSTLCKPVVDIGMSQAAPLQWPSVSTAGIRGAEPS